MSDADEPILPLARFAGMIGDGENTVAITIDIAAGSDGRLHITPVEISREVYLLAVREFGNFEEMKEFSLTSSDEKGRRFTSDAVYVTSHDHSSHGFSLTLNARVACFEEDLVNPIDRPLKRVFFRGFKSFHGHEKNSRLGKVALEGAAKDVETDMITGWAGVQSHEPEPDDAWHTDADALLIHMQRGMGFAHGGRLQTPLFEEITSSRRRITFYEGSGWRAEHPIIPHLNQGPFFQSLVSRFEEHGPLDDVFWTASGWVHVDTTFDDVRFLTAMTAIETLASNVLPERLTTAVSKLIFKGIKPELKAILFI